MNKEQSNLFMRFDGYTVRYKPRNEKYGNPEAGGGIAIIVQDSISYKEIEVLGKDLLDHVGVKVETNDLSFNLVSLYAPSNTLKVETIKKYSELGQDLFLLGDLNSKTPTVGCRSLDNNGKILDEILSSVIDLCVLNNQEPTYFQFKSEYNEILD